MVLGDSTSHHDEFMTEHILLYGEFCIRRFVIIDEYNKNDAKRDKDNEELIYRNPDLSRPLFFCNVIHYF